MKKVFELAFLPFHRLWAAATGRAVGWGQWWPSVAAAATAAATLLLLVVVSPQKAKEAFVPSTDQRRAREAR